MNQWYYLSVTGCILINLRVQMYSAEYRSAVVVSDCYIFCDKSVNYKYNVLTVCVRCIICCCYTAAAVNYGVTIKSMYFYDTLAVERSKLRRS